MRECIDETWRTLERRGRTTDARALARLVEYWRLRTPLSCQDVCDLIVRDIREGWPIGLRKFGY